MSDIHGLTVDIRIFWLTFKLSSLKSKSDNCISVDQQQALIIKVTDHFREKLGRVHAALQWTFVKILTLQVNSSSWQCVHYVTAGEQVENFPNLMFTTFTLFHKMTYHNKFSTLFSHMPACALSRRHCVMFCKSSSALHTKQPISRRMMLVERRGRRKMK